LQKEITKEQLRANLVEYSLFTGKSTPGNMARFRKDMIEIEKVISEIHHKQLIRKTEVHFIDEVL
jgi:hypothetical protein